MNQYITALLSNPEFFKNVIQRYGRNGSIGMSELATAISNLEIELQAKSPKKDFEVEGFMKIPSEAPASLEDVEKELRTQGFRTIIDHRTFPKSRETWFRDINPHTFIVRLDLDGEIGKCQVGKTIDTYYVGVDYRGVINFIKEKVK